MIPPPYNFLDEKALNYQVKNCPQWIKYLSNPWYIPRNFYSSLTYPSLKINFQQRKSNLTI